MSKPSSITDCNPANTEHVQWLQPDELLPGGEVACPPPGACTWNSHPRVYMKISERGEAYCPYCSTIFRVHGGS